MPEDVQPDGGQGGEATGGLFDSYLQSVPENAREYVAGYLKDASNNVDGRLREAADFRKQWEPYQEMGGLLQQFEPDTLQQLVQWYQQVSQSDDAYREWLTAQAQEAGLTKAEAEQVEAASEAGDLSKEQIQQLIAQQADERIGPIQEWFEQQRAEQETNTETQFVVGELDRLEAEHKVKLSDEQRTMVLDLGLNFEGDGSWVQAGFDRFQEITTAGQRAFVEEKTNQPQVPLTSGGVARSEAPKTWVEAKAQALERMRQAS